MRLPVPQSAILLSVSFTFLVKFVGCFSYAAMTYSSLSLKTPVDINITFTTSRALAPGEEIIVRMPGFTRQFLNGASLLSSLNIDYGSLIMSPSIAYIGAWNEGPNTVNTDDTNTTNNAYSGSYFSFMTANGAAVVSQQSITFSIYKGSGIGAYCGFPSSKVYAATSILTRQYETGRFRITTNSTTNSTVHYFDSYLGMGVGCTNQADCSGHGACDYCYEKCHCFDGFGSPNDTVTTGRDLDGTCSQSRSIRVTPYIYPII